MLSWSEALREVHVYTRFEERNKYLILCCFVCLDCAIASFVDRVAMIQSRAHDGKLLCLDVQGPLLLRLLFGTLCFSLSYLLPLLLCMPSLSVT